MPDTSDHDFMSCDIILSSIVYWKYIHFTFWEAESHMEVIIRPAQVSDAAGLARVRVKPGALHTAVSSQRRPSQAWIWKKKLALGRSA